VRPVDTPNLDSLSGELDAVPGTVSVWCARLGEGAAFSRHEHITHYAASTMKVAIMAAAYHLADTGHLDLDAEIDVHDTFTSATGTGTYRNRDDYDNDEQPWARLGRSAPLRWLIRRMIVKSSNLATNLVLERVHAASPDALERVWTEAGAAHSVTHRGIEDYAARDAGLDNVVTAYDLAALLTAIRLSRIASRDACAEMLEILLAQEVDDDIVQGLPDGTRVAHKNGWITAINHSAALVLPDDAPEFVLTSCISAPLSKEEGQGLLARIAAAAWTDRHTL
jgi:beta-lactamase class A